MKSFQVTPIAKIANFDFVATKGFCESQTHLVAIFKGSLLRLA